MPDDVLRLRATVVSDEALANIRKIGREIGLVQAQGGKGAHQAAGSWGELGKQIKGVGSELLGAVPALGGFGLGAAGAGVAARLLVTTLGDISKGMVQMGYASKELGIGVRELKGFQDAAQKVGIAPEAMMQGLANFRQNMEDFKNHMGSLRGELIAIAGPEIVSALTNAKTEMDKLKVAFDFKQVLDQFDQTGQKGRDFFKMMGLGPEAARLSWTDLVRTINTEKAFTPEQLAAAKQYQDSLIAVGRSWDNLKETLGARLMPGIAKDLQTLTDIIEVLEKIANWKGPSWLPSLPDPQKLGDRFGRAIGFDPAGLRAKHDAEDRERELQETMDAKSADERKKAADVAAEHRAYRGDTGAPVLPEGLTGDARKQAEAAGDAIIAADARLKAQGQGKVDEAAAAARARDEEAAAANKARIDEGMARMRQMQEDRRRLWEQTHPAEAPAPPAAAPPAAAQPAAPQVTTPPAAAPAAAPPRQTWGQWLHLSSVEGGGEDDFRKNIHTASFNPAGEGGGVRAPTGGGFARAPTTTGDETQQSRIIQIGVFDALVDFKSYLEAGASVAGGGGGGGGGSGGMPGIVKASFGGGGGGGGGFTGGGGGAPISGGFEGGGGGAPSGATAPIGGGQSAPRPGPGGQGGGSGPGQLGAAGGKSAFYDEQRKLIYDAAVKAKLPHPEVVAEVGATQAQLESGGGERTPGGFNVYGIKSGGGVGGVGPQVSTQEEGPGGRRTEQASFATFGSKEEAAAGYVDFLQKHPKHYAGVTGAETVEEGLAAQGASGYATASDYGPSLQRVHQQFGGKTIAGAPARATGWSGPEGEGPTANSFANQVLSLTAAGGSPKNIQDYLAANGVNMSAADCGAFMAQQVRLNGGNPPPNPAIASSWNAFGEEGYSSDPNAINIAVKQGVQTGATGSHVTAAVPELDEKGQPTGRFKGVGVNQGFGTGSMRVAGKGDYGRDVITSNPIDIGDAPGQYHIRHGMRPPPDVQTAQATPTSRIDAAVAPPAPSGQVQVTVNSNGTKADAQTKTEGQLFQPPTVRQHRQMQRTEDAGMSV